MKTFTIDRSKWLSGDLEKKFGGNVSSTLCDEEGRKCCLGFYLQACRVPVKNLLAEGAPSGLTTLPKQAAWLVSEQEDIFGDTFKDDSEAAGDLMGVNDNAYVDDREREKQIKATFKKQGITVKFTGKYPSAA